MKNFKIIFSLVLGALVPCLVYFAQAKNAQENGTNSWMHEEHTQFNHKVENGIDSVKFIDANQRYVRSYLTLGGHVYEYDITYKNTFKTI